MLHPYFPWRHGLHAVVVEFARQTVRGEREQPLVPRTSQGDHDVLGVGVLRLGDLQVPGPDGNAFVPL